MMLEILKFHKKHSVITTFSDLKISDRLQKASQINKVKGIIDYGFSADQRVAGCGVIPKNQLGKGLNR